MMSEQTPVVRKLGYYGYMQALSNKRVNQYAMFRAAKHSSTAIATQEMFFARNMEGKQVAGAIIRKVTVFSARIPVYLIRDFSEQ